MAAETHREALEQFHRAKVEFLRRAVERFGSKSECARRTGISQPQVSQTLSGYSDNLTVTDLMLVRLAAALEMDISQVLFEFSVGRLSQPFLRQ